MQLLSVSVTYFRKYHADFEAIEAELRECGATVGERRYVSVSDDQIGLWWRTELTSEYDLSDIALVLMQTIGDMHELLKHRPRDLITASIGTDTDYYSLSWTPRPDEQQRCEAAATIARS
jgi:hypothetical protein